MTEYIKRSRSSPLFQRINTMKLQGQDRNMRQTAEKQQNEIERCTPAQLKEKLIAVTLGGSQRARSEDTKAVFGEYVRRALPKMKLVSIEPFETTAALNSVAAFADVEQNGTRKKVFLKVHIESGTKSLSALGVEGEYRNAKQLEEAGWPVLTPLEMGCEAEYPLLVYPRIEAPTFFQMLEESYRSSRGVVTETDLKAMEVLNKQIGQATQDSVREVGQQEAANAPIQNLFLKRFEKGGRIDQWYTSDTEFWLPGLDALVRWEQLKTASWIVNGVSYSSKLGNIVDQARELLAFHGEDRAAAAVSHGDDHAGNVFIDRVNKRGVVFDPAFAGVNPVSLCDLKAFAHTGFLPMAGLYYDPKLDTCRYQWDAQNNVMSVEVDFQRTPIYAVHETMARQIMDTRIVPLLKKAQKECGVDIARERERIICGLVGCALLTINVAQLLQ